MRSILIAAIAMLLAAAPQAEAGDVKHLVDTLHAMRNNPDQDVFLRVGTDTFELVRMDEKEVTKADFDQAMTKGFADGRVPELEFSARGTALVIPEGDDASVLAYSAPGADESSRWTRRSGKVVETYARKQWREFMKVAVENGLVQYVRHSSPTGELAILHFRGATPSSVPSPGGAISLSSEFYDTMQLATEFPANEGRNGFVLLVHEPHSDFVGQQNMLRGLRALRAANSNRELEFLVEGAYEGKDRTIGLNDLDKTLDATTTDRARAERLVLDLLSRHVINGPMAYRLLDDRNLHAYAIDDNQALRRDIEGAPPMDGLEEVEVIGRISATIVKAFDGADAATQNRLTVALFSIQAYLTADIGDIQGQQLVDYFGKRASAVDLLAKLAKAAGGSVASDLRFLKKQGDAYRRQAKVYSVALERNPTMSKQIGLRVSPTNSKISVGFIGSFHTPGVTAALKAADIGYLVVEPRIRGFHSSIDEANFSQMIHPATRSAAITKALSRNSGPVAPSVGEVRHPIKEFWRRSPAPPEPAKPEPLPTWNLDRDRLSSAVLANSGFGSARVDVAPTDARSIPNGYKDAFAFFEPGDHPRVVVIDPESKAWKTNGRYEFLENAITVPPRLDGKVESRSAVTFYQSHTGKQVFGAVHDPQTGRFYLMSTDAALDLIDHIGPPPVKSGEKVRVHMRLSELMARANGEVS